MTLLSEVAKLGVSLVGAWRERGTRSNPSTSFFPPISFTAAVPALCYAAKNNLVFVALTEMSPVAYAVFGNLKIPVTLFLSILVARFATAKSAKGSGGIGFAAGGSGDLRIVSILLLGLGMAVTQLPPAGTSVDDEDAASIRITPLGFLTMLAIAAASAGGSLATEWLMKGDARAVSASIHVQNGQLYTWGVALNIGAILATSSLDALSPSSLLSGYNVWTWAVIANNVISGYAVSAILKWANSVVKLFVFATSLFLTTALSASLFGTTITLPFILGASIIISSLYLYNRDAVLSVIGRGRGSELPRHRS